MFLGVLLDSELKFSQHINYTCKKISKTIGILFRIRHFIPKKVALNLYYALAYQSTEYSFDRPQYSFDRPSGRCVRAQLCHC